MSKVRTLIRAKLEEKGLSLAEVSRNVLGRNHAYLQQYLEREVPKKLPEDVRGRLAQALGIPEGELRETTQPMRNYVGTPLAQSSPRALDDRLQVLGMAECGPDGWSLWNGDVIDTIPRPANLTGAPNAYAVYIAGTSMEPRYHPGELAHIHPGKPITIGSYVLVQKRPAEDGEAPLAVIKRLAKRTGSKITLEQFNPPKQFEIKTEDLISIHRVVGAGEA